MLPGPCCVLEVPCLTPVPAFAGAVGAMPVLDVAALPWMLGGLGVGLLADLCVADAVNAAVMCDDGKPAHAGGCV